MVKISYETVGNIEHRMCDANETLAKGQARLRQMVAIDKEAALRAIEPGEFAAQGPQAKRRIADGAGYIDQVAGNGAAAAHCSFRGHAANRRHRQRDRKSVV